MKTKSMNPIEAFDVEEVAVISAKISTFRTLPGGVVRMMVEVDPNYNDIALCAFSETGSTVALARLKEQDEKA